jgi:DNA-binding NarL/FixJ family response regulator
MANAKPLAPGSNPPRQALNPDSGSRFETPSTPTNRRIRVLVADDHPVVRKGIVLLLSRHQKLEVVDEAKDGREALQKAKELTPDIILMDIDMPHLDGLALTEILRKELPGTKVILLSGLSVTRFLPRLLQSGARGFLSKAASPEELLTALELVAAGDTAFSPEVARLALNQLVCKGGPGMGAAGLTNREREIIILIAKGLSNKEIAAHLDIGTRTVETHREHVMRKLNIHSVAGLTTFAVSTGLVHLPEGPID